MYSGRFMEATNQNNSEILELEKILKENQTNNPEVYYWPPTWENYLPEPDYSIPTISTTILVS
jgi:hypothetical protein